MIHTQLHDLLEMSTSPVVLKMNSVPRYVISPEVIGVMRRPVAMNSVAAMIEAGICKLPYPAMLIEFSVVDGNRIFVLLRQGESCFHAQTATLRRRRLLTISDAVCDVEIDSDTCSIVLRNAKTELDGAAAGLAVIVGLLMLTIRGINRELIEPRRLNRKRAAKKRVLIPSYTYIRVGTIYDRSGNAIPGEGHRMPVYLQPGRSGGQTCGKDGAELAFIPPMLVNFREDDGLPALPMKRVVV